MVQHAYFEERQRVAQAAGDGPVGCTWAWVTAGVVVRQDDRGCVECQRPLSHDARMYFRMPIPSDARFVLLELTHRLSSLVQRPLPLNALAADHAARVNATASLTLTHARAALDEPVTELPFYNLDPPAWCPSESLGERLQARVQARDSAPAFTPRMPHP